MRVPFTLLLLTLPACAAADLHALVAQGLGGEDRYEAQFTGQVEAIRSALGTVTGSGNIAVFSGDEATRAAILDHLDGMAASTGSDDRVIVILVGHGSYDDIQYKFNVPGPDITGEDLAAALDAFDAGVVALVNTSSASGAIAGMLDGERRIIVLATKSGKERHATRFGEYFAAALGDERADVDKNGAVTVAEAFRYGERRVADYFERNGTLATEHATLDGELAGRVELARLDDRPAPSGDAALARLLEERDALAAEIDALRLERDSMPEEDYQAALLPKVLELARLEDAIEAREAELGFR